MTELVLSLPLPDFWTRLISAFPNTKNFDFGHRYLKKIMPGRVWEGGIGLWAELESAPHIHMKKVWNMKMERVVGARLQNNRRIPQSSLVPLLRKERKNCSRTKITSTNLTVFFYLIPLRFELITSSLPASVLHTSPL